MMMMMIFLTYEDRGALVFLDSCLSGYLVAPWRASPEILLQALRSVTCLFRLVLHCFAVEAFLATDNRTRSPWEI